MPPILFWFALLGLLPFIWLLWPGADLWFSRVERSLGRLARRKRAVVLATFLVAIAVRLLLLPVVRIPVPEVHDEFSYLLQADTFAHGRLTNPPHPMWVYLDTFHVLQHPTYASIFPPAQGAALALGQLLGHPWIGVLLSSAAMCAALTWMLQGWLPPQWAMVGAALVMLRIHFANYWLESYWGGAVAAVGGALVLGALPRIMKRRRTRDALLMSIGMALLANSRPLEGFIFCVPIAVWLVLWIASDRSPALSVTGPKLILPMMLVLGATFAFILYDNWRITSNPFLLPHTLYDREYINYRVFRWQDVKPPFRYLNPQFEDYFNHWVRETFAPSWNLLWEELASWWLFFVDVLFAVVLLDLPRTVRDRRTRFALILFMWCALGLLVPFTFEPHYAAPMTAAFVILLAQCFRHLRRWRFRGRPVGIFLTRLVILLAIVRISLFTIQAYRLPRLDWSFYRDRMVQQLEHTPGKHLVIVHYEPDHYVHNEWVYNGADIDGGKVVWAREIPGINTAPLLRYFRDRKIWMVEADSPDPALEPYRPPTASVRPLSSK